MNDIVRVYGALNSHYIAAVDDKDVVWLARLDDPKFGARLFADRPNRGTSVDLSPFHSGLMISSNTDTTSRLRFVDISGDGQREICIAERGKPIFSCVWLSPVAIQIVYTSGSSETLHVNTASSLKASGRGFALGWSDVSKGGGMMLQASRGKCALRRINADGAVEKGWLVPDSYIFHLTVDSQWMFWAGYAKKQLMRCARDGTNLVSFWSVPWVDEVVYLLEYLPARNAVAVCTYRPSVLGGRGHICLIDPMTAEVLESVEVNSVQVPDFAAGDGTLLVNRDGMWRTIPSLQWEEHVHIRPIAM